MYDQCRHVSLCSKGTWRQRATDYQATNETDRAVHVSDIKAKSKMTFGIRNSKNAKKVRQCSFGYLRIEGGASRPLAALFRRMAVCPARRL